MLKAGGEMTSRLQALATVPEDPGLPPSTQVVAQNNP